MGKCRSALSALAVTVSLVGSGSAAFTAHGGRASAAKSHRAPAAGYLTLLFGRAQWTSVGGHCAQTPGALTLQDIADGLHTRGLAGTATVVLDRIAETTRLCRGVDQQASWVDLGNLQAIDG